MFSFTTVAWVELNAGAPSIGLPAIQIFVSAPPPITCKEVDGGYHAERAAADARRDRDLERLGFSVLRVSHDAVMNQIEAVLALVRQALGPPS